SDSFSTDEVENTAGADATRSIGSNFFATQRKVSGRNGKYDNSTHKTTNAKTKNTKDNTYEANIPIYIACCNGTRCDAHWRCARALRRDAPADQPIELSSVGSRQANVRRVRLHRPARHLPGRPLGRDRHRRRPPGPAHFGQR